MKERDLVHGYFSIADKMQLFFFVLTLGQICFFSHAPFILVKQVTVIHRYLSARRHVAES